MHIHVCLCTDRLQLKLDKHNLLSRKEVTYNTFFKIYSYLVSYKCFDNIMDLKSENQNSV